MRFASPSGIELIGEVLPPKEAFKLEGYPHVAVVFHKADGEKCQRCWKDPARRGPATAPSGASAGAADEGAGLKPTRRAARVPRGPLTAACAQSGDTAERTSRALRRGRNGRISRNSSSACGPRAERQGSVIEHQQRSGITCCPRLLQPRQHPLRSWPAPARHARPSRIAREARRTGPPRQRGIERPAIQNSDACGLRWRQGQPPLGGLGFELCPGSRDIHPRDPQHRGAPGFGGTSPSGVTPSTCKSAEAEVVPKGCAERAQVRPGVGLSASSPQQHRAPGPAPTAPPATPAAARAHHPPPSGASTSITTSPPGWRRDTPPFSGAPPRHSR